LFSGKDEETYRHALYPWAGKEASESLIVREVNGAKAVDASLNEAPPGQRNVIYLRHDYKFKRFLRGRQQVS
jgi:hypothetical protein